MKTIVLLLKGEASLPKNGLNGLKPAGGSVMW